MRGILVQLATHSGARVIALAGSARKLDHARSLGADATINYRDPDWITHLQDMTPNRVEVVSDGMAPKSPCFDCRKDSPAAPTGRVNRRIGRSFVNGLKASASTVIPAVTSWHAVRTTCVPH